MAYKKVKLTHISFKALELGHKYIYPIFYKANDGVFKKLIPENTLYDKTIKDFIAENKIEHVFILAKDHSLYEADTKEYLSKIVNDDNVDVDLKSEILHEMSVQLINDLLEGDLNKEKILEANSVVSDTINIMLKDKKAIKAMLNVTTHDYYTYTHCVNVSTYALGFGAYLNLSKDDLNLLGLAGVMHDLGKRKVPSEIINKNGFLTDEEFEEIKKHPTYGAQILREMGEENQRLIDIVEQHHEKLNGKGYPYGLKENDIDPFSQIMAIADIFDALTTKRSYKEAMGTFEAFNIMKNKMGDELNKDYLGKFIAFMAK